MSENTLNPTDPKPGVYPGVPFPDYLAIDAASSHRLMAMARSAAHCKAEMDNPTKPTPDMIIGTACHLGILSPDLLKSSYLVALRCEAVLESGKNRGSQCSSMGKTRIGGRWLCGTHGMESPDALPPGVEILSGDQWEIVVHSSAAVLQHVIVKRMLGSTAPDDRELTIIWKDPDLGILCKARIDCLVRPKKLPGILYDLKSTQDASETEFSFEAKRRLYWLQMAWYAVGCAAAGIEVDMFYLVAFEKELPFGVGLQPIGSSMMEAGHRLSKVLVLRYAKCIESGIWPGYPTAREPMEADEFLGRRIERMERALTL